MDGFQRRKEMKKNDIRRAALRLFSSQGVKKTSIAEIARNASVSQVSIYNFFGKKEGLLDETVRLFLEEMLQQYRELFQRNLNFKEKIKMVILEEARLAGELHPEFIEYMLSDKTSIKEEYEYFYERKYIPLIMELIEQGRKSGYIHPELSDEAILLYLNFFRNIPQSFLIRDSEYKSRLSKEMSMMFFFGLSGGPFDDSDRHSGPNG